MFSLQITIAGIAQGCLFALAAMGVVLTYKATGIFNFAHGAIAMIVAYMLWEANVRWGLPIWLATPFAILIVGPAIGFALERVIFRPLQRKGASTSQKLVATLGVFLVCTGLVIFVWSGKARDEPRILSNRPIHLTGHTIVGIDQLIIILITIVVSVAVAFMFRFTFLGVQIRAVVDRRELAELSSINANRVAGLAWALGCGLAGLAGVLLVQGQGGGLDPFHLTLLVIETFSIAVVAGLSSLPVTVAAGVVLLGAGLAYFKAFEPKTIPIIGAKVPLWLRSDIDLLKPAFSVVVLFVALVVLRKLDEPADATPSQQGLVSTSIGSSGRRRPDLAVLGVVLFAAAVILPYKVNGLRINDAQQMLALVVIFASIVCITGYAGYITLGQAAFAGFGAYLACRMVGTFHLPVLIAMLIGGFGAMVIGLLVGYPALNRRGLFLGLTTLAAGLVAYEVVFTNLPVFKAQGLKLPRPSLFGWSFQGDRGFYFFELACTCLLLLLARNLRSGRMGRILAAMRDSEVAAQSIGIELRRYKLFIFSVSAFIAGIGGTMLTEQAVTFSGDQYHPLNSSLLWFTAVIVAGVDSLLGAIVGATLLTLLGVFWHTPGASQLVIALGALLIAYVPGGSLVGMGRKVVDACRNPRSLQRAFAHAMVSPVSTGGGLAAPAVGANGAGHNGAGHNGAGRNGATANGPPGDGLVPTELGRRVIDEARP